MKRQPSSVRLARYLDATARRLRRGLVGDVRLVAALLERAAVELRKVA